MFVCHCEKFYGRSENSECNGMKIGAVHMHLLRVKYLCKRTVMKFKETCVNCESS